MILNVVDNNEINIAINCLCELNDFFLKSNLKHMRSSKYKFRIYMKMRRILNRSIRSIEIKT